MYKLIALDLDGTLTDKNKNILEETKQELIKLAQKGYYCFSFWKTNSWYL